MRLEATRGSGCARRAASAEKLFSRVLDQKEGRMEMTLYDSLGRPRVYIADDPERSIYLWNGRAVAYIDDENVFGWRGRHIGWFVDGVLYDLRGCRVRFTSSRSPVAVHAQPAKHAKHAKHAKSARHAAYARVALSISRSEQDLESFVSQDAP